MAFCPECNATMGQTDIVCPDCGYDFPENSDEQRTGFAYTRFAEISLDIAAGLSFLMAAFSLVGVFVWVYELLFASGATEWESWARCIFSVVSFVFAYALFVVFVRVQKL